MIAIVDNMSFKIEDEILILNAVRRLNDEIATKFNWPDYDKMPIYVVKFVPKATKISVIGNVEIFIEFPMLDMYQKIAVYSSLNETRKYNDVRDTYESWYSLLRRQHVKMRKIINLKLQ